MTSRILIVDDDARLGAMVSEYLGESGFRATVRETAQFDNQKMIKAVAIWAAQKLGIPPAQAKAEILAIFRSL